MLISTQLNPTHSRNQHGLTFEALREATKARLPLFRDRQGNLSHGQPDGSDWSIAEWMNAVAGEVGEACNMAKKIRRGDFGSPGTELYEQGVKEFLKELADGVIYLDCAAYQVRRSLGDAVYQKFNEVSERVGCNILLTDVDHK